MFRDVARRTRVDSGGVPRFGDGQITAAEDFHQTAGKTAQIANRLSSRPHAFENHVAADFAGQGQKDRDGCATNAACGVDVGNIEDSEQCGLDGVLG